MAYSWMARSISKVSYRCRENSPGNGGPVADSEVSEVVETLSNSPHPLIRFATGYYVRHHGGCKLRQPHLQGYQELDKLSGTDHEG